ncbi:cyanate lyase C-terminal domain-containing protein [Halteromyces radiatus]|uniref:cyanate lyase C-terminal domain-containing protein n=1 Tax=Halteromyces radiatus TaxID=101107 RepID=UPI00222040D7|nr:cyanate lyase C-terminal domain-containing protein [Halteromyces radiatus]KAI8097353.1 cyanate lyase C-terminal domain-containing protein [Halteromyces radiatus]
MTPPIRHLSDIQKRLFQIKAERKKSFADIGKAIGRDEVYVAAIFYGQAKPSFDEIEKLSKYLNIPTTHLAAEYGPQFFPDRGGLMAIPPTDPVLYRLYEMIQVYGYPIKAIIHEKFGDGAMSAIDFTASVEKVEDPKGDRVKLIFDGKFLPYKKW